MLRPEMLFYQIFATAILNLFPYSRSLKKQTPSVIKAATLQFYNANGKALTCAKVFLLKGTVFTIDTHSMGSSLSTPFFPRR